MALASLIIMAAGLGSRYGGNKQIDGIGPYGETLMEYSVFDAVRAGFSKVVFVIKPEMYDVLRETCGKRLEQQIQVEYAFQTLDSLVASGRGNPARIKPYGTVHAMIAAKKYIGEPFAILNADDHYGASAFGVMCQELLQLPVEGSACMVGYRLADTLSDNGTVSRGICKLCNGRLQRIDEKRRIKAEASGIFSLEDERVRLPYDATVSMNFWGFRPWIFDEAEHYFDSFLSGLTPEDQDKAECLLPVMVNDMVREGKLSVNVLQTDAKWFGVTYKEDKLEAQHKLRKLHDSGTYPPTLRI